MDVLLDSGASAHYIDDAHIPGLQYELASYQVLDAPCKITTTGGHQLDEVAWGLLCGSVVDGNGA